MWGAPAELPEGRKGFTVVAKPYGIVIATDSFSATPAVALPEEHFLVAPFTAQDTARRPRAA
jgi:hypothetical protein